jgi:hypothetical protein
VYVRVGEDADDRLHDETGDGAGGGEDDGDVGIAHLQLLSEQRRSDGELDRVWSEPRGDTSEHLKGVEGGGGTNVQTNWTPAREKQRKNSHVVYLMVPHTPRGCFDWAANVIP